ncbi:FMN-binding protein [Anaeroselena agilis]|uniref:FMN-binding protein n=1 Tax=Anaeroselena agilis TaxID=3063788 RepID=A0ABU3NTI0_9FIRM|nr:FMN-binding protein [Selenomonadales bacterium 4137-cl]
MSKKTKITLGIVAGVFAIGLIAFLPFAKVFLGDTASTATIPRGGPNPAWQDGIYIGRAVNQRGPVELEVMFENGKFHHIKALSHNDTSLIFDRVLRKLTRVMLIKNSTDVDGISGATVSSRGIIDAVNNAVQQATKTTNVPASTNVTEGS